MSGIKLYICNSQQIGERRGAVLSIIAPHWREKCLSKRNSEEANQELAAGYLMYSVLGAGRDFEPVLSSAGKPLPTGDMPHFNLSHSGDWTVLAVSDCPVGVDIEQIGPVRWAAAGKLFSRSHLEELENSASETMGETFTRLWTRREAALKLTGIGFSRGLEREGENDPTLYFTEKWDNYIISCASEKYDNAEIESVMQ